MESIINHIDTLLKEIEDRMKECKYSDYTTGYCFGEYDALLRIKNELLKGEI